MQTIYLVFLATLVNPQTYTKDFLISSLKLSQIGIIQEDQIKARRLQFHNPPFRKIVLQIQPHNDKLSKVQIGLNHSKTTVRACFRISARQITILRQLHQHRNHLILDFQCKIVRVMVVLVEGTGTGTGMEMEMEENGCLNLGIAVMGISQIYLRWEICIRTKSDNKWSELCLKWFWVFGDLMWL